MNSNKLRNTILPLALLILFLAACGKDDPVKSGPRAAAPRWQEVDLGPAAGESRALAVDFTGNHGLALRAVIQNFGGSVFIDHEFFRLQPDGDWLKVDLGNIRSTFAAMDVAVDTTGKVVLAGFDVNFYAAVVLDLRGSEPEYIEKYPYGMMTVDGEGSFMVAGGLSSDGGLWTSVGPGDWNFDDLPLTGTNDSGFYDVYIRGDRAVACGFDDGADTLRVILTRTAATDWEKIQLPGHFGRSYYCVALSEDSTLYVGGIEGAGGMSPRAFLAQRTAGGVWADVTLPDPELLHGVMDILIADDESIYLACQGEGDETMANLVHIDQSGARKEITPFPGGLLQVGQAADGNIYAVGFRRDATGNEQGIMLVKIP